jgi:hypothetical protein
MATKQKIISVCVDDDLGDRIAMISGAGNKTSPPKAKP